MKLYAVMNDAGETAMVIADTMVGALDLWRAEYKIAGSLRRDNAEDTEWPVSIAMIHEGTILGVD